MTGTLVLYPKNKAVILISEVEQSVVEEIKAQCGCDHCMCSLNGNVVDFGQIDYVTWRTEPINLEYGF
ncbi:hypothetical protein [Ammoniphilus sp. 3BR4]|uniref:hypothetical protein n=1 Tax=Ammoniphilus sp. 3BR4 TaxID=3158265 RepID=UPI00346554DE